MSVYPGADIERAAANSGAAKFSNLKEYPNAISASAPRAVIVGVAPESPADDAGFYPGCSILSVNGAPVRDLIDWRWLTAEDEIELAYIDAEGDAGTVVLEREEGEDWGIEFEGVVFDGVKQCRNACTFCFMRQLPDDMRPSLTLRDDDFRLSFLSGTFVTLTNMTAEDEARIIEQHISPLRISLHASNAQVRRTIIGKHAAHGIEVLERLLAAGIEFHAQIVLMPGVNDGEVLRETLEWAYERPGILDVCIVPLGYTKHQTKFDRSFNEPGVAASAMDTISGIQQRALSERGSLWAFAADEFYTAAYGEQVLDYLPSTDQYGDFSMFEDGVGIIRSFADDWQSAVEQGLDQRAASALARAGVRVSYISGCATKMFWPALALSCATAGIIEPLFVKNDFFGGNVDVTGLLCGCDMVRAIQAELSECAQSDTSKLLFAIPRVVFNDNGLTLDDMSLADMEKASGARLAVVSCNASEFFCELAQM